jgi:hypothetical protein
MVVEVPGLLRPSDCGAVHARSRYSIDNFDPTSSISGARHLHGSPPIDPSGREPQRRKEVVSWKE